MKKYIVSIQSHNFTSYNKAYTQIKDFWCICSGKVKNDIFIGDQTTLATFYLTFYDNNLIVKFKEIKETKI